MPVDKKEKADKVKAKPTAFANIWAFVTVLLKNFPDFTGQLEINFKDGKLMDINETRRTKF